MLAKSPDKRHAEAGMNSGGTGQASSDPPLSPHNLSSDGIYEFYTKNLFPAVMASVPILFGRIRNDISSLLLFCWEKMASFLLPWRRDSSSWSAPSIASLWNQSGSSQVASEGADGSAFVDYMLRRFDTDGDGHISASELLQLGDYRLHLPHQSQGHGSWFSWLSTAWPAMDWKLGIFLWRTCGGLLLVIIVCTIVPGRLHGYSGRILRWPILGLTYFMIAVELAVYTMIRMFIRLVEWTFATTKHRALRNQLKEAESYDEWYRIASELDMSQRRDAWRRTTQDCTSYRYNWSFVNELINDMRTARRENDSLLALAVLQQCTRKNVGGVMSEDLFSYTNTGEPKYIVAEFIEEVCTTLRWVTEQARAIPLPSVSEEKEEGKSDSKATSLGSEADSTERAAYEKELKSKVKEEKSKMYGSLIQWATLTILGGGKDDENEKLEDSAQKNEEKRMSSEHAEGPPKTITAAATETYLPFLHREQVKTFLKRARAAYGRTALCLSGGAMMGNYHFGHVRALIEEDALPHIISGTSAGSVVGAMLCTRTREELDRDMRPEVLVNKLKCFSKPWLDRFKGVYKNGCLFDFEDWIDLIQWFTFGDMTFEEAYKKTGRVFCITLSATTKKAPPVLVNHITAPNVTLASAIIASAAVPGFINPVRLQLKGPDGVVRVQAENKDQTYWDGSIEQVGGLWCCQLV
uniref:Uncharacterized protein n=1 Tax=Odontella aurita TaxID=265563 RepID=A0A7S4J505_9STRA|mmetsp:Transcript_38655/g.116089  ORF Transcript_38655/g.116089 Transcript_38655/m.116089 type:complete len:693 (+) Transcript_38655:363-2441(+)